MRNKQNCKYRKAYKICACTLYFNSANNSSRRARACVCMRVTKSTQGVGFWCGVVIDWQNKKKCLNGVLTLS